MRCRIKICCIALIDEAPIAIRHGASAVSLVSAMPSGPGVSDEPTIARAAATIRPGVDSFLLTSCTDPETIALDQHKLAAFIRAAQS